ncbi:Luciferase-like, subgroup [Caldalkalibacillus thermarum TA2.A1]|uniref:Luciferase-like, subgroup n=1 Tax=Caldalkalibacillus thermarum (strain TA2.A1) TaxID=986075 RepID=F5L3M8_CALTT|nr:Luciferase-like, subgroup [Caldalkalibacillus thermarum TA2.A1]
MRLSILDQSILAKGRSHQATLAETVKLAQEAEMLGYHRFWVS